MTNALAVREPTALDIIRDKLVENRTSIEQVLTAGLDFDRLMGVAIEGLTRQPKLLQCTVPSIIRAIHQSAQLGLEPSGLLGSAYLVPYRNKRSGKLEAQLIVGYRGLIELADRTAGIQIQADVVYEANQPSGDTFEYSKGTEPSVRHIPNLDADRVDERKITHAYAIAFHPAWAKPKAVVMTRAEIERIQRRAQRGGDSPWNTDWAAMARKTPIRQIGNQLPLRVQRLFEQVLTHEDSVEKIALPATSEKTASRTVEVRERLAARVAERRTSKQASTGTEPSGAGQEADGDVSLASSKAADPGRRGSGRGRAASSSTDEGAAAVTSPPAAAPSPAEWTKDEVEDVIERATLPWPEERR